MWSIPYTLIMAVKTYPVDIAAELKARGMLTTAKEADVDRPNLYRILSGESDPGASTLAKIAMLLVIVLPLPS